ncbi:hypothetical protein HPC49_09315, partial [Pyxidicoccus fallax]
MTHGSGYSEVHLTGPMPGAEARHARADREKALYGPGRVTGADSRHARARHAKVLYALGLAVAAGCLFITFRDADLARAWAEVARLGPVVLLALVPYGVSLVLDGHAWSRLLAAMGRRAEAWRLVCLRAGVESLALGLPAGALLAETMKPVLLRSRCGVPLGEGVGVIAVRKVLILLGHGLYL